MSRKSAARKQSESQRELLDAAFFALSDPVRRNIVERLQSGPLLVSELAEPFSISIQAISRHIQVLEDAGLVLKERSGRIRRCSLDVGPSLDLVAWLNRYSAYWQGQFAQLNASLRQAEKRPAGAAASELHARSAPAAARSARTPERRRTRKPRAR